jgi:hypothetical protein
MGTHLRFEDLLEYSLDYPLEEVRVVDEGLLLHRSLVHPTIVLGRRHSVSSIVVMETSTILEGDGRSHPSVVGERPEGRGH